VKAAGASASLPLINLLAEVHHCAPLHDPNGELNRLKDRPEPYPLALGMTLVRRFRWEIVFSAGNVAKVIDREDLTYVAGAIFLALACPALRHQRHFSND